MLYGEEVKKDKKMFKAKRQIGKQTNFLLAYGGGPNALTKQIGLEEREAERVKATFDKSYGVLRNWWANQKRYDGNMGSFPPRSVEGVQFPTSICRRLTRLRVAEMAVSLRRQKGTRKCSRTRYQCRHHQTGNGDDLPTRHQERLAGSNGSVDHNAR